MQTRVEGTVTMANPIKRLARITVYVVAPEIPFTPPAESAAGAVVKTARVAGAGPVARGTARVKAGAQRLRMTRIRIRRSPEEPLEPPPDG